MERYLKGQEKLESRDLWEEAFPEDSKAFDDYYFDDKLKDNRILAIEENGRIQSMIQLNPYLLQVAGRRWRTDYLVGVATRKDKRHQGYMRRLLARMMADMRAEGMPFCFLMPADEAIYLPFGFTFIFRQPHWRLKKGLDLERRPLLPWGTQDDTVGKRRYLAEMASWMQAWLEQRYQVFAVRDEAYLRRLLKEIASEKGTLDVLYEGDKQVGMISEWGINEREQRLLYGEAPFVEEEKEASPAIMARIITVEEFVKVIRLQKDVKADEVTIHLRIEDPLVAENDGSWIWHLTHETSWLEKYDVQKCDMHACDVQECDVQECDAQDLDLTLKIEDLTAWLFGYRVPEAAKSWRSAVKTLDRVFLDEVV